MCCYNHLHLLHIWNRWNTQIIRLFHEILLYSKKKRLQGRLNSRYLHQRMASLNRLGCTQYITIVFLPLSSCHSSPYLLPWWLDQTRRDSRQGHLSDSWLWFQLEIQIESLTLRVFWETGYYYYTTWSNFFWHGALATTSRRLQPFLEPDTDSCPLHPPTNPPSCRTWVWMGAAWLSPADKSWLVLLLVGKKKDAYA